MLNPKIKTLGLIILTRENIISLVDDGDVVYAKVLDNESNILLVKININIIIVNDKKYLRIDKKDVAQDNLKHNLD